MAKYEKFEDLPVWQEAKKLHMTVAELLESQTDLPVSSTFRSQLERAALSVSSQIAAGYERSSQAELQAHIGNARAASAEVRSMIAVVCDRPRLARHVQSLQSIRSIADSCARQLGGWSNAITKGPAKQNGGPPSTPRAESGFRRNAD